MVKARHQRDLPMLLPRSSAAPDCIQDKFRPKAAMPHRVDIQMVRSVSDWSAGVGTESSIHNAYIEAIEDAERFIYIENQFFITSLPGSGVWNGIGAALVSRIVRLGCGYEMALTLLHILTCSSVSSTGRTNKASRSASLCLCRCFPALRGKSVRFGEVV